MISYRRLASHEFERVRPVFEKHGGVIPCPSIASIFIAEEDGVLLGFAVVQQVIHLEPIWLENEKKAPHTLRKLIHLAETEVPPGGTYYAFSDNDHVTDLAKSFGLEPLNNYRVFMKEM